MYMCNSYIYSILLYIEGACSVIAIAKLQLNVAIAIAIDYRLLFSFQWIDTSIDLEFARALPQVPVRTRATIT